MIKKIAGIGLLAACALSMPASAATVALQTSDLGWYNVYGFHNSWNENTLTGKFGDDEYRSWYVWQLPSLSDAVVSARIEFDLPYSLGTDAWTPQLGRMFDISAASLSTIAQDNGGGFGQSIFDDLGSGAVYGDFTIAQSDNLTTFVVDVNAAGIAAINAASGDAFALGIRNVTPQYMYYFLFSSGSFRASQRLVLETAPLPAVPEPETWALMAGGLALVGAARAVKRRPAGARRP
jgi:hypothetical protein